MKIHNRILSTILAVVMMLGTLTVFSAVVVGAEEAATPATSTSTKETSAYVTTVYANPEEKLATMTKVGHLQNAKSELYVDTYSGEVAVKDIATGQIMFSNPYDVASSKGSDSTKMKILSQLVVHYIDNGTSKELHSFEEAAMRDQITVLKIKNGIRVEYTIGREVTRKLVPRWITVAEYDQYIKAPLEAAVAEGKMKPFDYNKYFEALYIKNDPAEATSIRAREQMIKAYPISETDPIYVISSDAKTKDFTMIESYIKQYCEEYTFEMMDAGHEYTGFEGEDEQYPVFKMALEYTLDANGELSVCLPCNGLRYDMAKYTLEYISILPYMGAGNSLNAGYEYESYNFYPDGSGSLFDYEELNTKTTTTVRGKVYGLDFAYHNITGVTYQKAIRYPVYGSVSSERFYNIQYKSPVYEVMKDGKYRYTGMEPVEETVSLTVAATQEALETYINKTAIVTEMQQTIDGVETEVKKKIAVTKSQIEDGEVRQAELDTSSIKQVSSYQRGYVAIIESGESLAEIATYHAGSLSDYNTMMNYFNPKPKDSYDLADSISVSGTSTTWTVVSDRKYTGNITIRYQMLTDAKKGADAKAENAEYNYYESSWLGMAKAYRDYLIAKGTLTKLTDEELEKDIPLYVETFGALETKQQIATIPMDVMTPLTTFGDVWTMYTELSDSGVNNINFKLTGYANGGMYYTVPAKLKWEKAVGGADGLNELINHAKDENAKDGKQLGLFPDFDFAYIQSNSAFDSTRLKDDAVKTIDNRYSSLRQYSATQQSYVSFYQLAVSPSRYSKFYEKLLKNYSKYDLKTMSVASLGTALNSDFDEDDPYNREDSKENTVQAFSDMKAAGYSLMTEGANAYTWGYVDHIINVDLDSSRYIKSSASVPFIGAVLHGYIQFAGTPLNEEGDTDYAILRAIENGAGMYFILSYQNTQELKEDPFLSQYYSVRYDIWKEDMVAYYKKLNAALGDVQDKVIVNHQFLAGERVLNPDELRADLEEALKNAIEQEKNNQNAMEIDKVIAVADAWKSAEGAAKSIDAIIEKMKDIYRNQIGRYTDERLNNSGSNYKKLEAAIKTYFAELYPVELNEDTNESVAVEPDAKKVTSAISIVKDYAVNILKGSVELDALYGEIEAIMAQIADAEVVINNSDLDSALKEKMLTKLANEFQVKAGAKVADALAEIAQYNAYVTGDPTPDKNVIAMALSIYEDNAEHTGVKAALETLLADISESNKEKAFFNADALWAAANEDVRVDTDVEDDANEGNTLGKYVIDNNQIVVVTYGDESTGKAYKAFILNYNNFAVRVTYENKSYTIASGGYVVLDNYQN